MKAWAVVLIFGYAEAIFQIVPEDIPMSLIAVYGFSPPIRLGRDHRVGFGFRFGNHADLQVMYEFGPQIRTKPLQPVSKFLQNYCY
ncbi:uncharacterized protein [Choristoneura fumiferana]|uniref:uncharacterized protein n=1 Tax=Choristoneura fumiferana TaxID=7141 RepID=UPI003D154DFF